MFIIFAFFGAIIATLGYTLFNNFNQINSMSKEKSRLIREKNSLKEKKELLEADIEKLTDSEYIARYAREKYFYSKANEYILRIDDK